jgi:hypothetical protein
MIYLNLLVLMGFVERHQRFRGRGIVRIAGEKVDLREMSMLHLHWKVHR